MYLPLAEDDPHRAPLIEVLKLVGYGQPDGPGLVLAAWRAMGLPLPDKDPLAATEIDIWNACSPITWTWEGFGDVAFYGDRTDARYLSHVALVIGHQLVLTSEPWVRIERPRYRPDFLGCGRISSGEFGA